MTRGGERKKFGLQLGRTEESLITPRVSPSGRGCWSNTMSMAAILVGNRLLAGWSWKALVERWPRLRSKRCRN